jgi:hypothetical protein
MMIRDIKLNIYSSVDIVDVRFNNATLDWQVSAANEHAASNAQDRNYYVSSLACSAFATIECYCCIPASTGFVLVATPVTGHPQHPLLQLALDPWR